MKTTKITAWHIVLILVAIAVSLTSPNVNQTRQSQSSSATWQVFFSPHGGATSAIREALEKAEESVLAQAYSFTLAPIAEALVRAHRRGVAVRVILDRSQRTDEYSVADFLANSGIITIIDAAHAIAHSNIIIIANETVITGSFNFTKAAEERYAGNISTISSKEL